VLPVGPVELLIILVLLLNVAALAIGVIALVDIAQRSEAQFDEAGQNRTTWLIIAILSLFVPCVFLGAAYYLVTVRPKLPARRLA
jgi:hypothetical protein